MGSQQGKHTSVHELNNCHGNAKDFICMLSMKTVNLPFKSTGNHWNLVKSRTSGYSLEDGCKDIKNGNKSIRSSQEMSTIKVALHILETMVEWLLGEQSGSLRVFDFGQWSGSKNEKNEGAFVYGEERDKIAITVDEMYIKKKLKWQLNNKAVFVCR